MELIHSIHNLDVSLIFLHHKYFILFFFISAEAVTACRTFLAQMQGPATDQMRGAVRAYSRWYVTQCAILGFGSCLAVSKAPFSYPRYLPPFQTYRCCSFDAEHRTFFAMPNRRHACVFVRSSRASSLSVACSVQQGQLLPDDVATQAIVLTCKDELVIGMKRILENGSSQQRSEGSAELGLLHAARREFPDGLLVLVLAVCRDPTQVLTNILVCSTIASCFFLNIYIYILLSFCPPLLMLSSRRTCPLHFCQLIVCPFLARTSSCPVPL